MKLDDEQLSAIIDNEIVDTQLLEQLLSDKAQQAKFSRYHLIGDVMRGELCEKAINIDISRQVMAEIEKQSPSFPDTGVANTADKSQLQKKSNILSFAARFGQYAVAASVAGVVVVSSLMFSGPAVESSRGIEVLNTVPFGGAVAPVSLQAKYKQSKEAVKKHNERLEALLKDHQLQLQMQP